MSMAFALNSCSQILLGSSSCDRARDDTRHLFLWLVAAAKALADKQVEIAEEAKKKLEEAVAARASAQAQAEEAAKEASSAMQKAESAGTLFSLPALFLKTAIGRVGVRGQGSFVIV